ncbi:MAG: ABC transporter permease subunit, partial [Myxococcota bacterium]
MNSILLVATNTVRQTVRQRLFFNVIIFGVGIVALSIVVSFLTYGHPSRVVRSLGLSGVSLAIDLMALLLSVSLIHQEIDKKTLFVVLTRPLTRLQYVMGRFLGLMLALCLVLVGFSLVFWFALTMARGSITATDGVALLACVPEAAIIAAFGLVLSSFSTPTLSAGIGLGFWIASTTTDDLVRLTAKADEFSRTLASVVYYILPAFSRFDFREAAVYGDTLIVGDVATVFVYGAIYAAALVLLAGTVL